MVNAALIQIIVPQVFLHQQVVHVILLAEHIILTDIVHAQQIVVLIQRKQDALLQHVHVILEKDHLVTVFVVLVQQLSTKVLVIAQMVSNIHKQVVAQGHQTIAQEAHQ